jgi:alpha-tubulin suppressor-like RCC1 family protein
MRARLGTIPGLACLAALAIASVGCTSGGGTVRLNVEYQDSWGLTELVVTADGLVGRAGAVHELVIRVPPRSIDRSMEIAIVGLRDGTPHAAARIVVTPRSDREERATISLALLPCGAWCTEGSTQCEGDGVALCEQRDEDSCMEWGRAVPCGPDAPECAGGHCRPACFDECAEGESECAGPNALRVCAQVDSDACLDWQRATECPAAQVCHLGACRTGCVDACAAGDVSCRGGGVVTCGDRDFDGCLEWSPIVLCSATESCEAGACVPLERCTEAEACTASACDGDGNGDGIGDGELYRTCGSYDADPCLELSPGERCGEPCRAGRCTHAAGCSSTGRVCDAPPDGSCADGVVRIYDSVGACVMGECLYGSREVPCSGDPCAGLACSEPLSACVEEVGICSGDRCIFEPSADPSCDDGDPCTAADACTGGTCAGEPLRCDAPPTACHAPIGSCAGGACVYTWLGESGCDRSASHEWLALGWLHTCLRRGDGTVSCWGSNEDAMLGDGTRVTRPTPGVVPGLAAVVAVTAGNYHSCALDTMGDVWCWGSSIVGQIGEGTRDPESLPIRVGGVAGVVAIAAGSGHTCALIASGRVTCWGFVVGADGIPRASPTPTMVVDLEGVVELEAGGQATCARTAGGGVSCWSGSNEQGQLGVGDTDPRPRPSPVLGPSGAPLGSIVDIEIEERHACARDAAGAVWCWGANESGQLGDGSTASQARATRAVAGLPAVVELALGEGHSCAREAEGRVWCWGQNDLGQLGDGTRSPRGEPRTVVGLEDAIELDAAGGSNCARRASGTVVCWGGNALGQLGDGTTTERLVPTEVVFP